MSIMMYSSLNHNDGTTSLESYLSKVTANDSMVEENNSILLKTLERMEHRTEKMMIQFAKLKILKDQYINSLKQQQLGTSIPSQVNAIHVEDSQPTHTAYGTTRFNEFHSISDSALSDGEVPLELLESYKNRNISELSFLDISHSTGIVQKDLKGGAAAQSLTPHSFGQFGYANDFNQSESRICEDSIASLRYKENCQMKRDINEITQMTPGNRMTSEPEQTLHVAQSDVNFSQLSADNTKNGNFSNEETKNIYAGGVVLPFGNSENYKRDEKVYPELKKKDFMSVSEEKDGKCLENPVSPIENSLEIQNINNRKTNVIDEKLSIVEGYPLTEHDSFIEHDNTEHEQQKSFIEHDNTEHERQKSFIDTVDNEQSALKEVQMSKEINVKESPEKTPFAERPMTRQSLPTKSEKVNKPAVNPEKVKTPTVKPEKEKAFVVEPEKKPLSSKKTDAKPLSPKKTDAKLLSPKKAKEKQSPTKKTAKVSLSPKKHQTKETAKKLSAATKADLSPSPIITDEDSYESGDGYKSTSFQLAASEAYRNLIGATPLVPPSQRSENAESDSDDVERACAAAMNKKETVIKEAADVETKSQSAVTKKVAAAATAHSTQKSAKDKKPIGATNMRKNMISKASRKALGLDSDSGEDTKTPLKKNNADEDSDEFDFFN